MTRTVRLAAALGFVGAVAVAAGAVAQPGGSVPAAQPAAIQSDGPAAGKPAPQARCGRMSPKKARAAARVVASETKVRKPGGFAIIKLDSGKITAVSSGSITIQRADGVTVTVTPDSKTLLCRDGKPVELSAFKTGDVAAIGRVEADGKTIVRFVRALSPEAREKLQQILSNRAKGTDAEAGSAAGKDMPSEGPVDDVAAIGF